MISAARAMGAILVLPALLACGCYRYVNSRVTLLDAETDEPIRGATVRVGYDGWPLGPLIGPLRSKAITDAQGQAVISVAVDPSGPFWRTESEPCFDPVGPGEAWGSGHP